MGGKSGNEARVPREDENNLHSTQRVRIIDLIGEGPIAGAVSLQNLYLNDTPVQNADGSSNFQGIILKANRGTADQAPLSGFDSVRRSVPVGAELKQDRPLTRTVSDPQVGSLLITVGVQSLVQTTDEGDRLASAVDMLVEVGRGGRWHYSQEVHIEGKTTAPYYTDVLLSDLPDAPFNIRVWRLSPDQNSERHQDKTVWASYTEIIPSRLSYAHSAVAGLQIDSDQFGHSVPRRNYLVKGLVVKVPANYNPATRTYTGLWNGEFKAAWTDNPAWVFYDLVSNERYGLGKSLGVFECDKWALYQVAQYCDEMVDDGTGGREPRMTCNVCIGSVREAYALLNDLASAFRGIALWNGQALTVAQDRHTDPVWLYTNANVAGGRFEYSYAGKKAIHSVAHVQYLDKTDGWRSKIEYVEDRDLLRRYGENIKRVTAFGCTSRGQAARMGRWLLETAKHEQCTVTFTVGAEGLMHLPYDIIQIADNDYIGAMYGGRVQAVSGSLLTLDRDIDVADGGTLMLDGRTYPLAAQPAPNQVRLPEDVRAGAGAVWVLSTRQVSPRLFRAVSVEENGDDGTYTVVAVEHWAEKGAAVDKGVRFDRPSGSLLTLKPEVSPPTLTVNGKTIEFKWDASYFGGDLSYETRLYRNGVLYRGPDTARQPQVRFEDLPNGHYEVRIRARTEDGVYSQPVSYAFSIDYTITGLRTEGRALAVDVVWTLPEVVTRAVHTELWYGKSRDRAEAVQLAVLPYPQNRYTLTGVSVTDTFYFWARLADADGMAGEWTEAAVGQADQDPAPVVAQIRGAIEQSSLSQTLIAQLNANDTAAENRAKAAASADAADKVAAEAQARAQALRAEAGRLNTAITSAAQTARSELTVQVAQLTAKDGELKQAQTALDGKTAELTRTAQQLGSRITAAETVNREQATAIQTVTAAQQNTAAALETERRARANGDAAEARARETLAAQLGQQAAALTAERQARTDGDAAATRELQAAVSRIGAAESGIGELRQTVTRENSATAARLDSLTAKLGADTNLIDAAATQAGHYISEANGNVLNWNGHVLTDFVPVAAGQTYTFTSAVPANNLRWVWYNAQRGFISGRRIGGDSSHQTLTAPNGAAFIRISGGTNRNTAAFALRPDPTAAAVEAERTARAEADRAEAQARQTLAGKVDGHTAALAEISETKADKNQVAALARQTLSAEWQNDIAAAKAQAQQAAAQDAQSKADAARRAAEEAAARTAQSKADAAKASALAAASGDAAAKANAAKAQAVAEAAAKDEAVKREAAADAQRKADAVRQVAEAAQRAAQAVAADLTREQQTRAAADEAHTREINAAKARLGTAESSIGELRQTTATQQRALAEAQSSLNARLNAADTRNDNRPPSWYWANHPFQAVREFKKLSVIGISGGGMYGLLKTDVAWGDATGGRIEQRATDERGNAWRRYSNVAYTGHGSNRRYTRDEWTAWAADETVAGAQAKADAVREVAEAAQRAVQTAQAELTAHKRAQAAADAAQTAELQAARSQIGSNRAAIDGIRSTKADKTEVAALARTSLQSEWRGYTDAAKNATNARLDTLEQTVSRENGATANRFARVEAAVRGVGQIADTRNDNRPPSWYRANHANRTAEEFKKAAVLGLSDTGGEFVYLQTAVKWGDATGGAVHQSAAGDNGRRFARHSVGEGWSAWAETETVSGVQNKLAAKADLPEQTVADLTALNADTWYPLTFHGLSPVTKTILRVSQDLTAGQHNPPWATHNTRSFALICEWETNGDGWGTIGIQRTVRQFDYRWTQDERSPVLNIGQLSNGSIEYCLLRGGAKYRVQTPQGVTTGVRTTAYSVHGQTVSPLTAYDAALVPKATLKQAVADVQTAQTAVAELNGKVQAMYTVKVQAVGSRKAVAGLALGADGQTGDSQFLVMANQFALVRPDNNDVQAPFVVVQQHGRAQLALSGDMIADGLIHGKHIAAGQTLQAPVINGGSLNIGNGRFTVSSSGQVAISAGNGNVGLQITNNRILVYDAYRRIQVCLGELF